jgi:excisionase family DNA binding protein
MKPVLWEFSNERPGKRLYTVNQTAEYLGRSPWAVRSLIWSGKLPAVRDGKRLLLDVQDLDRWIEADRVNYAD